MGFKGKGIPHIGKKANLIANANARPFLRLIPFDENGVEGKGHQEKA
jgi:hypothetical protein